MPRLDMRVWQPGTERKASKKVLSCCQANLESCFHKCQVSFLVVKTAKCKRGISRIYLYPAWASCCKR